MKLFTDSEVMPHGAIAGAGSLNTEHGDLVIDELPFHKLGLTQTATGYGTKLTSRWKINFNGKLYRIYSTCYSNAASCWFKAKGRVIFVG